MITITDLFIYPVKSMAGFRVESSSLDQTGLKFDRRWMLVDEKGRFLSQRDVPKMALIQASVINSQLILTYQESQIKVNIADENSTDINVTVWNDTFMARHVCQKTDLWISEILTRKCRLVYMKDEVRKVDEGYDKYNQRVSFADGFPVLLISQASLRDLNSRLEQKISIDRFRPNFVIDGCEAFAEDEFGNFEINNVQFSAVKKCSRCVIPSINQNTAAKDGGEIIAVLNGYRKESGKIYFGQNLVYEIPVKVGDAMISCGDELKIK